MQSRKEIVLDTDWLTALIAACGLVFISIMAFADIWQFVHGKWPSPARVSRDTVFWRVSDSLLRSLAIWFAVSLCLNIPERLLRFALGFFAVRMTTHLLRQWLPSSSSMQVHFSIISHITGFLAFVLFAIYLIKWFRSKVVHV